MARYTSKNTVVSITDSGAGLSMSVGPGEGDLSIDNLGYDNAEILNAIDRGVHDGLVEGDDLIQAWSITVKIKNEAITHATIDRMLDAVRGTNFWQPTIDGGAAVSVDATRWAFIIIVTMNDGTTTSTITLPKATGIAAFAEGKDGHTLSISGNNYLAPTYV